MSNEQIFEQKCSFVRLKLSVRTDEHVRKTFRICAKMYGRLRQFRLFELLEKPPVQTVRPLEQFVEHVRRMDGRTYKMLFVCHLCIRQAIKTLAWFVLEPAGLWHLMVAIIV